MGNGSRADSDDELRPGTNPLRQAALTAEVVLMPENRRPTTAKRHAGDQRRLHTVGVHHRRAGAPQLSAKPDGAGDEADPAAGRDHLRSDPAGGKLRDEGALG